MQKIKNLVIAINLVAVLAYFAYAISDKEQTLAHAPRVMLKLAPVDPRSLMQGDYMALRFDVLRHGELGDYVVVRVSDGTFVRSQIDQENLSADEVALRVYPKAFSHELSSSNYFFEEGTGFLYEKAKYALVAVDQRGDILILNLCREDGSIIEPLSRRQVKEKYGDRTPSASIFFEDDSIEVVSDAIMIEMDSIEVVSDSL